MFTYSSNPINNTEVLWLWTNELACLGCGVGAASVGGTATWTTDRQSEDRLRQKIETEDIDRQKPMTDYSQGCALDRWQTDDRKTDWPPAACSSEGKGHPLPPACCYFSLGLSAPTTSTDSTPSSGKSSTEDASIVLFSWCIAVGARSVGVGVGWSAGWLAC